MTSPGDGRPRPSGFLANIKAAYTPRPLSEEEASAPLVKPRTVTIAGWLLVAAGLLAVLSAILVFSLKEDTISNQQILNRNDIQTCTESVGGIGTAAVLPAQVPALDPAATSVAPTVDLVQRQAACAAVKPWTESDAESFRTFVNIMSVVHLVVGLGMAWAGWNVRKGLFWARRLGALLSAFTVILVFIGLIASYFDLATPLFGIIAIALTYVGQGGRYFARVRGAQSR